MTKYYQAARATREAYKPQTFTVGVWHDGEEEYHSFGRVSAATPRADEDTVFPIASVSKSFIAASVLMLSEEGKLDIAKPLKRYIPDFAMYTDALTERITVRDAMCHCSGLPRHDLSLFTRANLSLEEFVRLIRWLPTAWPLHERFGYSNHMFAAVSLLVERVSAMPWEQFVNERVIKPLGMTRSYVNTPIYREADDNYARPKIHKNGRNYPTDWEKVSCCGCSGSICASARDLLQWAKLNLRRGALPGSGRLFSEASAKQLHGDQTVIKMNEMYPFELKEITQSHYCMGWVAEDYRGARFLHHGGTVSGFKSIAGFLPEKDFAFVVLANSSNTGACDVLGRKLCDAYLGYEDAGWDDRYKELTAPLIERKTMFYTGMKEPPDQAPDVGGLAGRYENKAYGIFTIRQRGGKLTMHNENVKRALPLLPSKSCGWVADIPSVMMALPCRFEMSEGFASRMLLNMDADLHEPIAFERIS